MKRTANIFAVIVLLLFSTIPQSFVFAANCLTVTIGTVQGSVGSTVQVPINFTGVPSSGINSCDFGLQYDPDSLDILSVSAGSILQDGGINFNSHINSNSGIIKIMLSEVDKKVITSDGVFATITARIKSSASLNIGFLEDGDFIDYNLNTIPFSFQNNYYTKAKSTTTIEPDKNTEGKIVLGNKRTKDQLFKIANYHINHYIKSDNLNLKDKKIVPSNDMISLYDLNNNIIAYIVPLIDVKAKNEIGYITIGAVENASTAYEVNLNINSLQKIRNIIINNKSSNPKVIFSPPIYYILQRVNKDTNEVEFVDIDFNKLIDSQKILKNSYEIYKNVFRRENSLEAKKILDQTEPLDQTLLTRLYLLLKSYLLPIFKTID